MGTLLVIAGRTTAPSAGRGRTLDGNSGDSGVSKSRVVSSYTCLMARGWESKSVEAQQEETIADSDAKTGQLTPEQLAARKRREELTLIRKKIEHDLAVATNPRHRQMLQQALADVTAQAQAVEEG